MKLFRKMIAVLLLAAVALLPAAGMGEETINAFDTLRVLMEMEFDEGLPPAQGESIYTEVDDDTAQGLLCTIVYGEDEKDSVMMISGINGEGKYEEIVEQGAQHEHEIARCDYPQTCSSLVLIEAWRHETE